MSSSFLWARLAGPGYEAQVAQAGFSRNYAPAEAHTTGNAGVGDPTFAATASHFQRHAPPLLGDEGATAGAGLAERLLCMKGLLDGLALSVLALG
jgi:hypothetical protein